MLYYSTGHDINSLNKFINISNKKIKFKILLQITEHHFPVFVFTSCEHFVPY